MDSIIQDLDFYEILQVSVESSTSDIKKAYRKKALQCHPDKNPNNPNAVKEFHQLSKILEILIDVVARKAYDQVLKGRQQAALRHKALDNKRQKLKADLEEREKRASHKFKTKSADELLRAEIDRLRKEGSRLVEEEIERVQKEVAEQLRKNSNIIDGSQYRIKIKWKVPHKDDTTNGGYTKDMLHTFLTKYGNIVALVLSTKKKGSALVEFETKNAAEMAVDMEKGIPSNPLRLEWVNGQPPKRSTSSFLTKPSDFESVTLTKLRQAEERRRLIEQLTNEDI